MGRNKKKHVKKGKKYKQRKRRGGIWITNKFGKLKSNRKHPPKPIVKKCRKCGARVLYHHYFCENCWREYQSEKEDYKLDSGKDKSL